jgi:DNA polymerase-3 subunit delta
MHVFDYLAQDQPAAAVCVLFGNEAFLKRLARKRLCEQVLGESDDTPFTTYDGTTSQWKDVLDELSTVSLFGEGARLVVIEQADSFVSKYRERLEDYVEHPRSTGILLLDVENWARNTRLYKRLTKSGLQIECRAPEKSAGSRKVLDEKKLFAWIVDWAQRHHECQLPTAAAEELVGLVGPEFGLLDQSLAKLALFADSNAGITPEMVRNVVGGWRAKTIWELVDAAADGDTASALEQLNHLLESGEHPVALFGQVSWSLRRFAAATRIYERLEASHQPKKLSDALVQAGFPHWNRRALSRAEKQLTRLGRVRAGRIYQWLLEADLALKGTHSSPHRARLVLERLIGRLGQTAAS